MNSLGPVGPLAIAQTAVQSRVKGVAAGDEGIIDTDMMERIANFFQTEPLVQKCLDHRAALSLVGDIYVAWGPLKRFRGGRLAETAASTATRSSSMTPDVNTIHGKPLNDEARDDLKKLMRQALEFKEMFGMCPLKVNRPKLPGQRSYEGRRLPVRIPPVESGRFRIYFDHSTLKMKVVFEVDTGNTGNVGTNKVKELPVFIWPGHEPRLDGSKFHSTGQRLIGLYLRQVEMRENASVADYRLAHPPLVTQSAPQSYAQQSGPQFDEQIYGNLMDSAIIPQTEAQRYRRDVESTRRLEMVQKLLNAVNMRNPNAIDMFERLGGFGKGVEQFERSRAWDGVTHRIQDGDTTAAAPVPTLRRDLVDHEERYATDLCVVLGVPRAYISAGAAGRFKADSEREREILRVTRDSDREALAEFFSFTYDLVNRDAETEYIIKSLLELGDLKRAMGAPSAATPVGRAIKEARADIKGVLKMKDRARIYFVEDTIPRRQDPKNILIARARGHITRAEEINLMRAQLDLGEVAPTHELVLAQEPPLLLSMAGGNAVSPGMAPGGGGGKEQVDGRADGSAVADADAKAPSGRRGGRAGAKRKGEFNDSEEEEDEDNQPKKNKNRSASRSKTDKAQSQRRKNQRTD